MSEQSSLLITLVLAVAHMRRAQREYADRGEQRTLRVKLAAEKEVDALIELHLTPSTLKGASNADLTK